jgi:hypothetical protein
MSEKPANIVNGTADSNATFSEQCTIETISKIPPIKLGMALISGGTVDIFRTVGSDRSRNQTGKGSTNFHSRWVAGLLVPNSGF